jgi:transcription termination/antitermination protein NusG
MDPQETDMTRMAEEEATTLIGADTAETATGVATSEAPAGPPPAAPTSGDGLLADAATTDGRLWYVIHTYSGYENKVKKNLEHRIATLDMVERIFRVEVPTVEEIEIRSGQRHPVQRKIFPGYVLVEMIMDDESWYVVRNTPGVTGFVGMGNKPTPLPEDEASGILKQMTTAAPTKFKVTLQPGQAVKITDGPFADFEGIVDNINQEKGKVRVRVSMFGRETPIELDFLQVERLV